MSAHSAPTGNLSILPALDHRIDLANDAVSLREPLHTHTARRALACPRGCTQHAVLGLYGVVMMLIMSEWES